MDSIRASGCDDQVASLCRQSRVVQPTLVERDLIGPWLRRRRQDRVRADVAGNDPGPEGWR
jgi:hypothetical protein